MRCAYFQVMMDVYIEGRLADSQARQLERHIAECPACASELSAWRRMFAGLCAVSPPPSPEKIKARLRDAMSAAKRAAAGSGGGGATSPVLLREYTVAAACSIMVLAMSLSMSNSGLNESDGKSGRAVSDIK